MSERNCARGRPFQQPPPTHSAFLSAWGTHTFSYRYSHGAAERYLGVCACLFQNQDYNQMRRNLQAGTPGESNALTSSAAISGAQFYLAGAVVDKLRLYLADRDADFSLAGLSAILTPICEYLLSLKGRLTVYMPRYDKGRIRAAFDRLKADGDTARRAEFFQSCLVSLHFEDVNRWPGLKLAQAYTPSVMASILGEGVAKTLDFGRSDSPSAPRIEERWLSNQLIGSRYGQVLVE